ncbi:MAG: hypothetical protein AB7J28_14040 [Hyphomonadaceae bacterium]
MRMVLLIAGVVALATGVWWVLQGTLAIFPAGQMAGRLEWAYAGGGAVLVGVALIAASRFVRRR